ncbi:MAG TPA: ABC transporter substrate-binding protein [Gaiellaceae bacterium]
MSEHEAGFTRRDLLKGGAIGAAGLYLGGAGSALAARLGQDTALSADAVTLNWLTWFDHYFPQQLQVTKKRIGIGARTKLAPSDSQIYTTIRQTGSQFDISAADALWVPKMHKDGLTQSFDLSSIAASKQLYSVARSFAIWKDGSNYMAFPNGWSTIQTYYNPKYVKTKPDSYDALLDPKYKKKIVYEDSPENFVGFAGLATGAKNPYDQTLSELARSKAWLKKLKPNILKIVQQNFETVNALKDESAWIGLGNLGVELRVKAAGGPLVKVAYPKEGLLGWFDGEQMVKASKHKDLFAKFMNSVEGQTAFAAKNFIKNGRPMFNEKAYKLLVNQGYKQRADLFHYNEPERILKSHLQGPSRNPQATTQTFTEVFGG